jgi:hypothetical protein
MKNNSASMTNSCIPRCDILTSRLRARGSELLSKAMLGRRAFLARARAGAIVAPAGFAIFALGGAVEADGISVTCTNPYSGVSWPISIDYDRKTVDANPASITEREISWRDAKDGWNYTLDRKSGALTVILASATGGNFLFDRCRIP